MGFPMQPDQRLHILTITVTLIFFYFIVKVILPVSALTWLGSAEGAIVAYLSTFGAFKSFHGLIAFALNNMRWLKRFFLGKYYIEGTWVGYYYGEDKKVRYVVDEIDQEIGAPLSIHGKAFTENNNLHATWDSVTASFYRDWKKLIYAFDCEIITPPRRTDGITNFHLQCTEGKRCPNRITGSATNTDSGQRLEVNEVKISDGKLELVDALVKAKEFRESILASLSAVAN
jgi:hypothetical protein